MGTHRLVTAVCTCAVTLAISARAEMDYEFAKALLERDQTGFTTTDLVERLAQQLEQNPATLTEAKLIKAVLRRRQAATAGAGLCVQYLDEASALYKEILAGPRSFALYAVAEQDSAAMTRELLYAKLALAKKDKPQEAEKLRREAAALMETEAKKHLAAATAAFPEFKKWYDKYIEAVARASPPVALPRELREALERTFNAWVTADQRYINAAIEQLECYADADPARKPLARQIAKYCATQADSEYLAEFPLVSAWYWLMQGRTFALLLDEPHADEAWKKIREMEAIEQLTQDQRRQLTAMKKAILREQITLRMKVRSFQGVVDLVMEALLNPEFRDLWAEDLGKRIMLDYAQAMTLTPDAGAAGFERALTELQKLIDREPRVAERTPWTFEFSAAMAGIAADAQQQGLPLRLSAAQWYHVALGFSVKGQEQDRRAAEAGLDKAAAAAAAENACRDFQNAADCYRRAIAVARSDKTDVLARLRVEPRAWSELAACYLQMRRYYEAVIACNALRGAFLPEARGQWLQPRLKAVPPREQARLAETLADIEPLLSAAASRKARALAEDAKVHRNPWADLWRAREMADASAYQSAKAELYAARGLVKGARQDPAGAARDFADAASRFVAAAEKFLKVESSSADYELALFNAGGAFSSAQELWAAGRVRAKNADEQAERSVALARRALDAFRQYEDYVSGKSGGAGESLQQQRQQFQGAIWLARTALHSATREWDSAVRSADAYLAWEKTTAPQQRATAPALCAKFRALLEQAAAPAPACDPFLAQAQAVLSETARLQPPDRDSRLFMLDALSRRYVVAAAQAETAKLSTVAVAAYSAKVAELLGLRLDALGAAATLEDHSRALFWLHKAGDTRNAIAMAQRLLTKFDRANRGVWIPDDPKPWQELLAKMLARIKYADLAKWDRCKLDHQVLIDYLYDSSAGTAWPENDPHRPHDDRYNMNLDNAARQLGTIRRNYPDCQTLDPRYGQDGKPLLDTVAEEIDFRRKIAATRKLLIDLALSLVEGPKQTASEAEARTYREIAGKQIDIQLELAGNDVELRLKSARLKMLNAGYDEALKLLREIQVSEEENSPWYFDASKMVSEVCARQGKWREAAEFPEFVVLTAGAKAPIVIQRWPDITQFLKNCYAHGAPRPATLKLE